MLLRLFAFFAPLGLSIHMANENEKPHFPLIHHFRTMVGLVFRVILFSICRQSSLPKEALLRGRGESRRLRPAEYGCSLILRSEGGAEPDVLTSSLVHSTTSGREESSTYRLRGLSSPATQRLSLRDSLSIRFDLPKFSFMVDTQGIYPLLVSNLNSILLSALQVSELSSSHSQLAVISVGGCQTFVLRYLQRCLTLRPNLWLESCGKPSPLQDALLQQR